METQKAYAKINLSLDICGKRNDGYHELRSVMQTVGIHDDLIFEKTDSDISIECDKATIPLDNSNLIYKTFLLLKERYNISGGIKVVLKKRIPVAAGMAGGSADSAATFRGVNNLYNLGLDENTLQELAAELGSDISFCIKGGTCLCEGRGEILTQLKDLNGAVLLVAKPDINVSTKEVYTRLDSLEAYEHPDVTGMLKYIEENDFDGVISSLGNSLEAVTIPLCPVIAEIKSKMVEEGALKSMMSGSGPSVFGFFETKQKAEEAKKALDIWGKAGETFVTSFEKMGV